MDYHSIQKKYNQKNKIQKGGVKNLKQLVYKLFDNRLLDLYLKTLGITTLTTTTLVPIALIMGKDQFSKVVNRFKQTTELPKGKIPVLDHDLLGNYLKLGGLGSIAISPSTLLPIGFVITLMGFIANNKDQTGGSKLPIGTNFPPSYIEVINNAINVTGSDQGIWRSAPYINNNMQFKSNATEPQNFML